MRTPEAVAAMACPVCRTPLAMSERAGIEIDYCPSCRGVWLDRGELDKIVERSAAPAVPEPPRPPAPVTPAPGPWGQEARGQYDQRGHYDQRGYKQKRRKSFLEELFD